MLNQTDIKRFIVRVAGGSGCLVRPMDGGDKMFILTAKHLFENIPADQEVDVQRYSAADNGYVKIDFGVLNELDNYFPHPDPNVDAAILTIPLIEGLDLLLPHDPGPDFADGFYLCGYPQQRVATEPDPYRINEIKLFDPKNDGTREGEVANNFDQADILGQSGGGIVRVHAGAILLAGVQSRVPPKDCASGRVFFLPMLFFEQIVDTFGLPSLLPYYMSSFQFLKDYAMQLRAHPAELQHELDLARKHFRKITDELVTCDGLRPLDVRNAYRDGLLSFDSIPSDLLVKKLWIAWLEFLIVLSVCKKRTVDAKILHESWNEIRLIFANIEGDWMEFLKKILKADFSNLIADGVVVVSTPEPPSKYFLEPEFVDRIVRTIDASDRRTDIAAGVYLKDFKYVHLYGFQILAIIKNANIYGALTEDDIKALFERLRHDFEQFINVPNN